MSVRRLDPVQPDGFAFTAENLMWAKKTIDKYPAGKQASAVIPVLWRAQEQNEGWVSRKAIEAVADMLAMSYIRVLEVATFYTMFQLSPVGTKAHIQVCGTTPCMLRGAEELIEVCQNKIHRDPHRLNADGSLSWEEVECLGACVNAPMVQVFKDTYEDLAPARLEQIIDEFAAGRKPKPGPQIDRQFSAPAGGATALADPALYSGNRTFTRVEPPPPAAPEAAAPAAAAPPPPVPPAAATAPAPAPTVPSSSASATSVPAGTPAPAHTKPAAGDIRPVTEAAKVADTQKTSATDKEAAAAGPGSATTEKAQAETGVVRTTEHKVEKAASVTPPTAAAALVEPKVEAPALPAPEKKPALAAPEVRPALAAPAIVMPDEHSGSRSSRGRPEGQPELLKKPPAGKKPDDLELIWGVGPGLARTLNTMGFWYFDQIAAWTKQELKWVDANLKGFKGRATRDEWVPQAKKLATGWRPESDIGDKPTKKK